MSNENVPKEGELVPPSDLYNKLFDVILAEKAMVPDVVITLTHLLINIGEGELRIDSSHPTYIKFDDGRPCVSVKSELGQVRVDITCADDVGSSPGKIKGDKPLKDDYNKDPTLH